MKHKAIDDLALCPEGRFTGADEFNTLWENTPRIIGSGFSNDPQSLMQRRLRALTESVFVAPKNISNQEGSPQVEYRSDREIRNRLAQANLRLKLLCDQVDKNSNESLKPVDFVENVSRDIAKTVQYLFSPKEFRSNLESENLAEVIIDPEKIDLDLVKDLGLYEFLGSPSTNIELLRNPDLIIELRKFVSSLVPIREDYTIGTEKSYFRLFRIGYGSHTGKVIGTYNPASKKDSMEFFVINIVNQELRLLRISESQKFENRILNSILLKTTQLYQLIRAGCSEEEYTQKATELEGEIETFNNPENQKRVSINKKLKHAKELRDSKKRINRPSREAILVHLQGDIKSRQSEIRSIGKYIDFDCTAISPIRPRELQVFQTFSNNLEEKWESKLSLSYKPITQEQYNTVANGLCSVIKELGKVQYEPYLTKAQECISILKQVLAKIASLSDLEINEKSPFELLGQDLLNYYLVLKQVKFRETLIAAKIILGSGSDPETLKVKARTINSIVTEGLRRFKDKSVMPGLKPTLEFDFATFYKTTNRILALCRYANKPLTFDEAKKTHKDLKEANNELLNALLGWE